MDQSRSNNAAVAEQSVRPVGAHIDPPRRSLTLEFYVGAFTLLGLAACGYLAVGLGNVKMMSNNHYVVYAEFDNIAGLKYGASVEIAGVKVGEVAAIELSDNMARVALNLDKGIKVRDDDIFSIRTKGIIGDRYVKLSPGAGKEITPGSTIRNTESVVDIEDIIGKFVHNLDSGKSEEKSEPESKE